MFKLIRNRNTLRNFSFNMFKRNESTKVYQIGDVSLKVTSATDVPISNVEDALKSRSFTEWFQRIQKTQFQVEDIYIQSIDMFGKKPGFIKFVANVVDSEKRSLPGAIFMRGGSVAVLPIFEAIETKEEFVLLIEISSVPTANEYFPCLPAGMLDDNGDFAGNMAREIEEELGIKIEKDKLVDLTKLAYGDKFQGMYPSIGGTDEYVRLFTFREKMKKDVLMKFNGSESGLKEEREYIRLKIVPLKDLWKVSSDSKSLSALTLYENLTRDGLLK